MPVNERYRKQVALLIQTIPAVPDEKDFALKGGTAINLFVRDMPRLSVDIDLTYLPSRVAGQFRQPSRQQSLCFRQSTRSDHYWR